MAKHGTSSRREESRKYYKKHRAEILAKRAARRAANGDQISLIQRMTRRQLQAYAIAQKEVPCMDCGIRYPTYVMDYDHVRGVKRNTIARVVTNATSLAVLQEEIAKCDVVCSNCHRIRTHGRGQCGDQRIISERGAM